MVKDPVCGMDVDSNNLKFQSVYNEKIYVFCSSYCKKSFDENPDKYINNHA